MCGDAAAAIGEFLPERVLALFGERTLQDIAINADGRVWVTDGEGHRLVADLRVDCADLEAFIRRVADAAGRPLSGNGACQAMLPSGPPFFGARVQGVLPPISSAAALSVRLHPERRLCLDDLVKLGAMSAAGRSVLEAAVEAHRSLLVCGPTGSGKTTLAWALLEHLATRQPERRVVIIEDTPEMQLGFENQLNLVSTDRMAMADLVKVALRTNPDTIAVGEIRGAEAMAFLDAMATGHEGGLSTLHAESCWGALERLNHLAHRDPSVGAGADLRPLIGEVVDLVISLRASKRLGGIHAVQGWKDGVYAIEEIAL